MSFIEILGGLQKGRIVSVLEPLLVGRDPGCDLRLLDARVSRRHCLITPMDDGTVQVKDLRSKNGTFVGTERVDETLLEPSADFTVGSVQIRLCPWMPSGDVTPMSEALIAQRVSASHLVSNKMQTLDTSRPKVSRS